MVDDTATDGEYLDLEIVEHELTRWLAMHDAARSIFEGLPPDQQEAIRQDGQASIVPLASLVSCRPELRELGATILRRVRDDARTIRTSSTPWVVEPGVIGLSHPLRRVIDKTDTETTRNGARVERDWQAEVERLEQRVAEVEAERDRYLAAVEIIQSVSTAALPAASDRS